MNIIKIYDKYHLPEILRMHMLRVAGCSNLIIDNWNGINIDKHLIIKVSLLHDLGNIVKISEEETNDTEFLKIRKKYFEKYGRDDDSVTFEIVRELGLTENEIEIIKGKRSKQNEETLKCNSYETKICAYCDQRCSPTGVAKTIKERLEDAKERYKDKPWSVWSNEQKANNLIQCALGIEKQIMEYCTIKPEDINDANIEKYIEKLKEYEI